jgi:hypothetical protein
LLFFAQLARDFFPVLIHLGLLGEAARVGAVARDPMEVDPTCHSLLATGTPFLLLFYTA